MTVFGGLLDRVRGKGGRAWAGSAEDLLYDGERIRRRVGLGGDDRVVVTTHRVLAFTPDTDGENYREVDLPNVTAVRAGHEGERNLLGLAARLSIYGVLLLALGLLVDFGSFVPTDAFTQSGATGQMGLGGVVGMLSQFLSMVARIDEFARMIGAVLVLFATFVSAVYLLTRERVLVVGVAGDEPDLNVPAPDEALDAAVADLEVVLFGSGSASETGVSGAVGGSSPAESGGQEPVESTPGAERRAVTSTASSSTTAGSTDGSAGDAPETGDLQETDGRTADPGDEWVGEWGPADERVADASEDAADSDEERSIDARASESADDPPVGDGEPPVGDGEPPADDPLAPDSGSATRDDIDRKVRETEAVDFTDTVDDIVGAAEESGGDRAGDDPDGDDDSDGL